MRPFWLILTIRGIVWPTTPAWRKYRCAGTGKPAIMASVTVTPGDPADRVNLSRSAEMLRISSQYDRPIPRVAISTIAVIATATKRRTVISGHERLANDGLELVRSSTTRIA